MSQYVLNPSGLSASTIQATIGQRYHVGFSDGTNFIGYNLLPDSSQNGGWHESSDLQAKDQLTQYSSSALIDRDFVNWPRVSQGDWSGGAGQPIFLNPNQYWDSNLDTRFPGYLTNSPAWTMVSQGAQTVADQIAVFNSDVYMSWGSTVLTSLQHGSSTPAPSPINLIDSGGTSLLYCYSSANQTLYSSDGSTFTSIGNIGAVGDMWVVKQGTFGDFLYYAAPGAFATQLFKVDLSNNTTGIAVPFGNTNNQIQAVAPYQTGIAILSIDNIGGSNSEVWYHDGTNATLLAKLDGYLAQAMVNCQGDLYVGAEERTTTFAPVLLRVGSSIEVVARFGFDPIALTIASPGSTIGSLCSSGEYVAGLVSKPILGQLDHNTYVFIFNTLTGAWRHLPNQNTLGAADFPIPLLTDRQLTFFGAAMVGTWINAGTGEAQVLHADRLSQSVTAYWQSGQLVTSRYDFTTPGIAKRFRSVEVHHSTLVSGQSVQVDLFVDQDPTAWVSGNTPSATTLNSTVGSAMTRLAVEAPLVGQSAFLVLTLTPVAGSMTGNVTVYWYSTEITTPFSWTLQLDCTARRRTLAGSEDDQGLLGKDLAYFWRNAWENGVQLTMYHRNGNSYTVELESVELYNPSPQVTSMQQPQNDEEYFVTVKLRQVA